MEIDLVDFTWATIFTPFVLGVSSDRDELDFVFFDCFLDLFDARHDCGVVALEELSDFLEGHFELFSAVIHRYLAGESVFSHLRVSETIFCLSSVGGGYELDGRIVSEDVSIFFFEEISEEFLGDERGWRSAFGAEGERLERLERVFLKAGEEKLGEVGREGQIPEGAFLFEDGADIRFVQAEGEAPLKAADQARLEFTAR